MKSSEGGDTSIMMLDREGSAKDLCGARGRVKSSGGGDGGIPVMMLDREGSAKDLCGARTRGQVKSNGGGDGGILFG